MKNISRILNFVTIASLLLVNLEWGNVSASPTESETQGIIYYVRPGANGGCGSWSSACALQTALFNATDGDQIWVASGTYKPTTSSNRDATFQLKTGVAIYGGFPAAGGAWGERDWETHPTTLSGDIGIIDDNLDNSYHVVTGSGVDDKAIVDGFKIVDGNADGDYNSSPTGLGGGMYITNSSPILTHISFIGNSAGAGGGMYNANGNPMISDVTFTENLANIGGGLCNTEEANPTLTNINFIENSASGYGGGLADRGMSSTLTNIIFSGNTAVIGGGMYNQKSVSTIMENVIFSGNTSRDGGGLYNGFDQNLTLTNVTFSGNIAEYDGGGMYNNYNDPTLINVTFFGNSADEGGGMYNNNSSPIVTNAIFWENTNYQISNYWYNSNPVVTYSDIQGGYPGTGNINANPLLVSLANNGGFTRTHALMTGSPAIDKGDPINCPATDQRYYPRPIDGDHNGTTICDMGAYEYESTVDGFTLTAGVSGNGSVDLDPIKSGYFYGELVILTAIADEDWVFTGWSGDASGTNNPLSLTIGSITTIIANFTYHEMILNITVAPESSGSVMIDPIKPTYNYGDVVTLTAVAIDDWSFTGWSGDASGTTNPLTLTIANNTNVTANFMYAVRELNISVTPEGFGSVLVDPLNDKYYYGDVITLTANAIPGWTFAGWTGDASGSINPLSVTMTSNKSITANFTQDEYSLNVSVIPAGIGSVAIFPSKPNYNYGEEVTLTATANAGWTFIGWSGDATGSSNPLILTIVGNSNVTATFTDTFFIYLPLIMKN